MLWRAALGRTVRRSEPDPLSPPPPADRRPVIAAGSPAAAPDVPRVTVLIPCWNAAGSIARALDSVLADRDLPLECVVVDDGSTDDTADVVRAIADRDARLVLVASPANEGVSAARNRGLRLVRGEWLTFLDADDRLLPGGLAALYRAAVASDALAVVGQRIWSDGEHTWISGLYDTPDIRVPGRKSLTRNPGLMYYASATGKLFHESCREDLWFQGRVLGDQPWTIRALLRAGDRIEVIGDVVYEWTRPRPGHEFETITAAKHRSARVAAEAVRVAIGALREVADEAAQVIPDEAARHTVVARYFDRLVRSDFAGPVSRAVASNDEGTIVLFETITAFLLAAPPGIVGRSPVVMGSLVVPPLRSWGSLAPEARAAAWSMIGPIAERGRAARGVALWRRAAWVLLAGLATAGQGRARPLADALASLVALAAATRRRILRRGPRAS
jgi:hypothetical protein